MIIEIPKGTPPETIREIIAELLKDGPVEVLCSSPEADHGTKMEFNPSTGL